MNEFQLSPFLLIVAGVVGLVAGGFAYAKETQDAKLGPIEYEVKDK